MNFPYQYRPIARGITGRSVDVLRRQADSAWLVFIDNPLGPSGPVLNPATSCVTLEGMGPIELVRTYDARGATKSSPTYLVDRIWPRGIAKSELEYDAWLKDVAPSTELRSWFGHQPDRFPEFRRKYRDELESNSNSTTPILEAATKGAVVLLYSAKDTEHNQAVVLRDWIVDQL